MRGLLFSVLALTLIGCGPPQADEQVVTDLRAAVTATMDAMAVPAAERPTERNLTDQILLLAAQSDAERVEAIRAGAYAELELKRDVNELNRKFAETGRKDAPPSMYTWLAEHVDSLTLEQKLLLNALARQFEREAGLK